MEREIRYKIFDDVIISWFNYAIFLSQDVIDPCDAFLIIYSGKLETDIFIHDA